MTGARRAARWGVTRCAARWGARSFYCAFAGHMGHHVCATPLPCRHVRRAPSAPAELACDDVYSEVLPAPFTAFLHRLPARCLAPLPRPSRRAPCLLGRSARSFATSQRTPHMIIKCVHDGAPLPRPSRRGSGVNGCFRCGLECEHQRPRGSAYGRGGALEQHPVVPLPPPCGCMSSRSPVRLHVGKRRGGKRHHGVRRMQTARPSVPRQTLREAHHAGGPASQNRGWGGAGAARGRKQRFSELRTVMPFRGSAIRFLLGDARQCLAFSARSSEMLGLQWVESAALRARGRCVRGAATPCSGSAGDSRARAWRGVRRPVRTTFPHLGGLARRGRTRTTFTLGAWRGVGR